MAFLKYYAIAALTPISLLFAAGFYLEPIQGDLTRLGNIAEKSWGWRAPQPVLEVTNNIQVRPTTIIIGDSFSAENLWQSAAYLHGKRTFLTFHWSDIGRPECLTEAIRNLKVRYPSVKNFLVQTIERSFLLRFSVKQQNGNFCKLNITPSILIHPGPTSLHRPMFDSKAPLPDLLYAIKAGLAETRTYSRNTALGNVYVSPLTRTDLFSNANSSLLLFYADDLIKNDWKSSDLELAIRNAKEISDAVSSKAVKLTYVVVPDKSTIYAPHMVKSPYRKHHDIWSGLTTAGVDSIDLYRNFTREAVTVRDFYLPNDTHLSVAGFISLGTKISTHLDAANRNVAN